VNVVFKTMIGKHTSNVVVKGWKAKVRHQSTRWLPALASRARERVTTTRTGSLMFPFYRAIKASVDSAIRLRFVRVNEGESASDGERGLGTHDLT
jgi:hypothetical protein